MSVEKIGKIEAISLILLIVINELVLNVPSIIIFPVGTGSTLNILFVSFLSVFFTIIICKLFDFNISLIDRVNQLKEYLNNNKNYIIFLINNDKEELERRINSRKTIDEYDKYHR